MFLLCLVRVVVICLLLYILGTLFINIINTMESTSTGWGYVIIHLPSITNTNGKCSLLQEYNNTISVFSDCIKFSNNNSK